MGLESREKKLNYIYGPVPSWRLGSSLGIDPISSDKKVCTFDCIYCQIGRKPAFIKERKIYVETEKIINELKILSSIKVDYITFSGSGEPTLAKNLGELIKEIRKIHKEKIAVLTNSSLINKKDVMGDLSMADFVIAKLDAPSQERFNIINKPMEGILFNGIIEGIKDFKSNYKGRLGLQIMFIEQNKDKAKELAVLAEEINPDEIQINTPLRPCGVKPLSRDELSAVKKHFLNIPGFKDKVVSVYEARRKDVRPVDLKCTLERRGKVERRGEENGF